MSQQNQLLEAALKYASKNLPVFPCTKENSKNLGAKRPLTKHGFYDATTDSEQIKQWWQKYPEALIGMPTGEQSGMWVLDVDSYKPEGQKSFKWLIENNGELPKTCISRTGAGGFQYFFKWPDNGIVIKNSTGVIAEAIDVRGKGGYIILPPSGHPSGGQYKWIEKTPPTNAPDWLIKLAEEHPEPKIELRNGNSGAYGKKALADEMIKLSSAGNGTRNDTLNECAYSLGQLIAGGELEHDHVVNSLLATAEIIGLKTTEARKTLQSGIKGGMQYPRSAPEKADIQYDLTSTEQNEQTEHSEIYCTSLNNTEHLLNITEHNQGQKSEPAPHNLQAAVLEFIENSRGYFTTKDMDSELGLTTRREKQTRSQALGVARERKLIKKDKRAAGKYHIINTEMEVVDLDHVSEEPFPVHLPFNLQNYVKIPKHAIIVLAGSSNAGKTSLMIETLRLNLNQNYGQHYYMSEMAPGEYKSRIMQFDTPLEKWKKVMAASKSYDFEGAIEAYNPNGLTCIDYLEEVDGEYFKIASSIREIYDALGDGVAMIAVQKKKASEVAFGGEATVQKSRLYLVLDFLCSKEHSIVCALKVYKLKEPRGSKNLTNHEMHFEIHSGSKFNVLMDWTPCSKVNRAKCAAQYETERTDIGDDDYMIRTVEGQVMAIKEYTIQKWQKTFPNVNVAAEIERIMEDSARKPFLKYKGAIHQIPNMLAKKNKEG